MRHSKLVETAIIGTTLGVAVVAVRQYAPMLGMNELVLLLLVCAGLFALQLVFVRMRRMRSGSSATTSGLRATPPHRRSRNPFAREVNWNWTGLAEPPTEAANGEPTAPKTEGRE